MEQKQNESYTSAKSYKNELQEFCAKRKLNLPVYSTNTTQPVTTELTEKSSICNFNSYTSTVAITLADGHVLTASSLPPQDYQHQTLEKCTKKKQAEQQAAYHLLSLISASRDYNDTTSIYVDMSGTTTGQKLCNSHQAAGCNPNSNYQSFKAWILLVDGDHASNVLLKMWSQINEINAKHKNNFFMSSNAIVVYMFVSKSFQFPKNFPKQDYIDENGSISKSKYTLRVEHARCAVKDATDVNLVWHAHQLCSDILKKELADSTNILVISRDAAFEELAVLCSEILGHPVHVAHNEDQAWRYILSS